MDIHGDAHVVRCDTDFLERAEHLAKLLQRATAFVHQLVGGHTGVRVRVRQGLDDAQHLRPDIASNVAPAALPLDALPCGRQARETQGRGKDTGVVLVASRELRFLQPRDGGAHPVVVGGAVAREFAGVVLEQDFSRGRDDRVLGVRVVAPAALVETAYRTQHGLDVAPLQPRAGGERELLLGVVGLEEQQAVRVRAISSRPAGFLEVALEGARNLGVNHCAHVRFVDSHAEGVGGDHDVDVAVVEAALDLALSLRRETGVKMLGDQSSGGERLRGLLGAPLGRAVDDGASRAFSLTCVCECPMDVLDALRSRSRDHHEFQIGAFRSTVDDFEPRLQRPFEMLPNFVDDIVLGGGGQAQDGRGILSVVLGDVTRDVAIVRAEIVPPLRQAVRLVHDPRADAAPRDRLPERTVAKLLRSDQNDTGVAETDVGKRFGAFRHGNETVDRGGAGDALAPHRRDLIGHQRHQRRNHHGERPGCFVAHQRRELIAERLSGSGGKDPEYLRAGEVFLGNGALQALAVSTLRPVSEGLETEPSLQRLFRVEMLRAPGAVSVSAARIAELRCQGARSKPLFDVGRNDGVPS